MFVEAGIVLHDKQYLLYRSVNNDVVCVWFPAGFAGPGDVIGADRGYEGVGLCFHDDKYSMEICIEGKCTKVVPDTDFLKAVRDILENISRIGEDEIAITSIADELRYKIDMVCARGGRNEA